MRISTKLISFLVTAVVAVMAVYALVTVSCTQERMEEEVVKMADHLGMALSIGVLHHLEDGDSAGVAHVLEMMERYGDVVTVEVFDADGRRISAPGSRVAMREEAAAIGRGPYTHNQQIVDARGWRVGDLRLVITGESLLGHVVQARNQILFAILMLTAVISASIVYFSRRYLAGPLADLTEGAEAIGRGELERRIEVDGEGEVAALARTFNQMAASLQETTRQIVDDREYIHSVIDSMPEGIVVVDCGLRVTAWNRTMASRYGRGPDDVQDRPLDEVLSGLAATPLLEELKQVLEGSAPTPHRSAIRLAEEPTRLLIGTLSPLRRHGDEIDGAVLVLADVTERLRLEQQMQRSDKLAAVGQLAAGIAHEIGTPLNVISGSAEYLKAEHEDIEELQTIVDEVTRISQLVQRLMSFARQEKPRVEAVDVGDVVDSVISLMQHQLTRQGVPVAVAIGTDTPPIAADRGQLQQVLLNLVMNAWQAMPGGGDLSITAAPDLSCDDGGPSSARSVVIVVTDTGQGIDAESLPRVFEPFYTTKDVGEGTGLGLAIVQRIVEDHNGSIELQSLRGAGTQVELRFQVSVRSPEAGASDD